MSWGAVAAITAIVSTVAGTAVSIVSANNAADAAEDAAIRNKQLADAEARNRELEAAEAIKRQRLRDQREKSAIRARLAQQGTLTTSGTPLLILGEVAANQELAIQDAVRQANMQASSLRAQGTMGLWEAEATGAALTNKSIAAGIDGLSTAAGSYSAAKYNGAFTPVKGA
jgi:hypothetical protein